MNHGKCRKWLSIDQCQQIAQKFGKMLIQLDDIDRIESDRKWEILWGSHGIIGERYREIREFSKSMDRVRDGIRSSKGCLAFTELPEYVVYNEEPISQGHETCSKKTCYCAAQTPPGNKKEEEEK